MQDTRWSCGYENLGALLRSLARSRRELAPDSSLEGLRLLIEEGWHAGFDPVGAAQLRPLRAGKWIGAPELLVVILDGLGRALVAHTNTIARLLGVHAETNPGQKQRSQNLRLKFLWERGDRLIITNKLKKKLLDAEFFFLNPSKNKLIPQRLKLQ